jgi:hypothetical protein
MSGTAYLLRASFDIDHGFTGTRIHTTKPVAVFQGQSCTSVPWAAQACDHLYEQCIPTHFWGRHFVVMPTVGRSVMSLASGTPWGRTIPGSQVVNYSLLCITQIVENKDVSLWISQVDTDSPVAEIRIAEQVAKQDIQTDFEFLLTFPFSKFVISFNLTETNTDVKQRLQLIGKQLDPSVFSAVESLIDGAIANFKSL